MVLVNRDELFAEASSIISGDRQAAYGSAKENFARTAALWEQALGASVSPVDVAVCMILLKIDRLKTSPAKADTWVDILGYAALGGEIATSGA